MISAAREELRGLRSKDPAWTLRLVEAAAWFLVPRDVLEARKGSQHLWASRGEQEGE